MTILRIGSNAKYANGWEQAFGKGTKKAKPAAAKASKKAAPSKKKSAPKKKAKK